MTRHKTLQKTYPVLSMSCASCAARINKILNQQAGVIQATVNYAAATALIEFNPEVTSPETLRDAVQKAGFDLLTDDPDDVSDELEDLRSKQFEQLKRRTIWAILLTIPVAVIGMFFMEIPYANEIMWGLSTPVVFWLGRDFYKNAGIQFKHRSANMDTLVALSTGIAYLFSLSNLVFPDFWLSKGIHPHVYFEASSVIITFILLGRLLEAKAKGNTSSAIRKLMGLQPKSVSIQTPDGTLKEVPVGQIRKGDIVIVKPGERIAVDGMVIEGQSYVDESMLSGEPVPVLKNKDTKVYAGTINQKGSFRLKAEKTGSETLLAHIIRMVRDAQGSKAPVQQLVDKIAAVFVPVILMIGLFSFLLWIVLDPTDGFSHGLLALVTVLIIACPCALGLATPTAIMVGIGKGAEKGILIKDAESLETARRVDTVVLDKTGTITEGKPRVTDMIWLNGDDRLKYMFCNLERASEHPLADAITEYYRDLISISPENVESITGKGIQGIINGVRYFAGNARLLEENDIEINEGLIREAKRLSNESKTVIWFTNETQALAVAGITDRIKASSREAVRQLRSKGIDVYMLTGDQETTARHIAESAGIRSFKSGILPDEKARFVKELQQKGKIVAMVGDGINDSAALAQADLSIAMGKGSDIAMDVAKMTIISSDLLKIPEAIRLSKSTVRTIKQNLFWAFIYNLIGISVAAGILFPFTGFLLNPMIAGAAMALSSVSVVTNSLRLKMQKD